MLSQQLIHSQNFSFEDRRYQKKQNQISLLVMQATHCKDKCLLTFPQLQKLNQLHTNGGDDAIQRISQQEQMNKLREEEF